MVQFSLQVFTTCGSDRKKKYLLDTFPQLREDHIGNSRSTSFEELVMHMVGYIASIAIFHFVIHLQEI